MQAESEHIEFKLQWTESIYKAVIAFANTDGGTIFVGVDDNGDRRGIENVDETLTRITNGIRDAISPDVTMFVKYSLEEDSVIKIEVQEGVNKPYYLKSKGITSSGVYVRQGASSAQASPNQIRKMIKLSDGDDFEQMRSLNQDLTFNKVKEVFQRSNLLFGVEQMYTLGLKNKKDQQYTNLAYILSDQCTHTTKIGKFTDALNLNFGDTKIFTGSILEQIDNSYEYLCMLNPFPSTVFGLQRVEEPDYPELAIREALLNAIVHRDYSYSGGVIININGACIEFISPGGLVANMQAEDLLSGISQPRNNKLAEIMYRLKYIESYGTGLRRIFSLYRDCSMQPKFEVFPEVFKLTLPNKNKTKAFMLAEDPQVTRKEKIKPTSQMQRILNLVSKKNEVNEQDVMDLLGVKKTRAYTLLKELVKMGHLVSIGRGKTKVYQLPYYYKLN